VGRLPVIRDWRLGGTTCVWPSALLGTSVEAEKESAEAWNFLDSIRRFVYDNDTQFF
jgi:hypothetical protein